MGAAVGISARFEWVIRLVQGNKVLGQSRVTKVFVQHRVTKVLEQCRVTEVLELCRVPLVLKSSSVACEHSKPRSFCLSIFLTLESENSTF